MYCFVDNRKKILTFNYLFILQALTPEKARPVLYDEAKECINCPRLTGIPPHIALLNQISSLKDKIEESTSGLVNAMRDELNKRGIGGETFLANEVLEDVRKLHKEMGEMIIGGSHRRRGGTVGGGGGSGTFSSLPGPIVPEANAPMQIEQGGGRGHRTMYCWGGMLHNVPENFELPKMTLQTLISYWHCGSTQPPIPPLRYARSYDFPTKKRAMTVTLSQMKRMMKEVYRAGQMVRFDFDSTPWNTAKATRLYEMIYEKFSFPTIKHQRRYSAISWKTYHNVLVKNRYKFVGEDRD